MDDRAQPSVGDGASRGRASGLDRYNEVSIGTWDLIYTPLAHLPLLARSNIGRRQVRAAKVTSVSLVTVNERHDMFGLDSISTGHRWHKKSYNRMTRGSLLPFLFDS